MSPKIRGSIIVYGGRKEGRINKIKTLSNFDQNHPDTLYITPKENKTSIGIGEARKVKKFLQQKPYSSDIKVVVIENAHALTYQAQNALLKSLEEPPGFAAIFLETKEKSVLKETVLSRCQKIRVKTQQPAKRSDPRTWKKIKRLSPTQKLDLSYKYSKKERSKLIRIMDIWIKYEREEMKEILNNDERFSNTDSDKNKALKNLQILNKIRKDLKETNVNLDLALDLLFLSLE